MPEDLADPTIATLTIARALEGASISAAVYGGLALAAYGEARETKDADFAVSGVASSKAIEVLGGAGLSPTLSFDRVVFGGNWISRLALFGSRHTQGFNVVDFVEPRSERYAAVVVARSLRGELRGVAITLVAPEDFVLLKVLSTRDKDLDDGASVVRALGEALDLALVHDEARRLAVEITDHDVAGRLGVLLERARVNAP